jgi:hypothetical protein
LANGRARGSGLRSVSEKDASAERRLCYRVMPHDLEEEAAN